MAFLSAILSLVSRKLGDLVRALFGWSVSALFGRQSATRSAALAVALALSVLWPLFVVGTFVPAAAAWALAFLPLQRWVGSTALRVAWIALALTTPLLVGAITRWVAPPRKARGSTLRALLGANPLTLGYMASFVITAVTVPVSKIIAAARGWTEEHAYVQPREGEYGAVIHAVAEAFQRAGISPVVDDVPRWMSLATRTLKFFARGVVSPMIPEEPQRVRGRGVEAYLYPADLVLRGEKRAVARVRAELTSTMLEQHAYLVESPEAQRVQEGVQGLWSALTRRAREGRPVGPMAAPRVREMSEELRAIDVPFEEWGMLERMLRRLERRVAGGPTIIDEGHDEVFAETKREGAADAPPTRTGSSVAELVQAARAGAH